MTVFVGDVGTVILVETGMDLDEASVTDLRVKKPDGTLHTWTGEAYSNDLSKIRYVAQAGDFDQPGKYWFQAVVEIGTWEGSGERAVLKVYQILEGTTPAP